MSKFVGEILTKLQDITLLVHNVMDVVAVVFAIQAHTYYIQGEMQVRLLQVGSRWVYV